MLGFQSSSSSDEISSSSSSSSTAASLVSASVGGSVPAADGVAAAAVMPASSCALAAAIAASSALDLRPRFFLGGACAWAAERAARAELGSDAGRVRATAARGPHLNTAGRLICRCGLDEALRLDGAKPGRGPRPLFADRGRQLGQEGGGSGIATVEPACDGREAEAGVVDGSQAARRAAICSGPQPAKRGPRPAAHLRG